MLVRAVARGEALHRRGQLRAAILGQDSPAAGTPALKSRTASGFQAVLSRQSPADHQSRIHRKRRPWSEWATARAAARRPRGAGLATAGTTLSPAGQHMTRHAADGIARYANNSHDRRFRN